MRIRSVKPEFWRSDDITSLSREHRLLFIGLWQYVDDNGVGVDDYRQIAADLFALEDDQKEVRDYVRDGLATLERALLIVRYEVDGKPLLFIHSWDRHQRVDRPGKPRYPRPEFDGPSPTRQSPENPECDASASRQPRECDATGAGEQGSRGAGATTSLNSRLDAGFDDFWANYPKKVDKQKAKTAWRTARRSGVPAEKLIDRAAAYGRERASENPKFTKYPGTWLNFGAYDNEPEQTQPGSHLRAVSGYGGPWQRPADDSVYEEDF